MSRWLFRAISRVLRGQSVAAALVALALTAAPLFAVGPGDGPGAGGGGGPGGGEQPVPTTPPVSPGDVPEINPSSAVGALVLLVGGTLLLTDRMRRRSSVRAERSA